MDRLQNTDSREELEFELEDQEQLGSWIQTHDERGWSEGELTDRLDPRQQKIQEAVTHVRVSSRTLTSANKSDSVNISRRVQTRRDRSDSKSIFVTTTSKFLAKG